MFHVWKQGVVESGLCYVGMSQRGPVFTSAFTLLIQIFVAIFDFSILHGPLHLGRSFLKSFFYIIIAAIRLINHMAFKYLPSVNEQCCRILPSYNGPVHLLWVKKRQRHVRRRLGKLKLLSMMHIILHYHMSRQSLQIQQFLDHSSLQLKHQLDSLAKSLWWLVTPVIGAWLVELC